MIRLAVIGLCGLLLMLVAFGLSHHETGAERSDRIARACAESYADRGQTAVDECVMREDMKIVEGDARERQAAVDYAVGRP